MISPLWKMLSIFAQERDLTVQYRKLLRVHTVQKRLCDVWRRRHIENSVCEIRSTGREMCTHMTPFKNIGPTYPGMFSMAYPPLLHHQKKQETSTTGNSWTSIGRESVCLLRVVGTEMLQDLHQTQTARESKAQRQMREEWAPNWVTTWYKNSVQFTLLYALSAAEQINQPAIAGKYMQWRW